MVLRDKSSHVEATILRQDIISILSESIRKPLTDVEPAWTKILSSAGTAMHPSVGQVLAEVHQHYMHLIGFVDSMLMVYGGFVPPPAVPREQVIITRHVGDCLQEVAEQAKQAQLMLDYKTVTGLPPINTDRDTLRRVIVEILIKMISITKAGGRVRVETTLKGNEVRIAVSSSGPALPQEEISDIFVGFVQGKHAEETYSSRLAMYLVRNNVERLGGRVWAESEEGRGTTVYFTMSA